MPKTKSTLQKLEALHGAVADILTTGLEVSDPQQVEKEDKDGNPTGEFMLVGYDARLVGQAMAFLKDNGITVDLDTEDDADAIQEELERIKGKKRTSNDPFADVPHH